MTTPSATPDDGRPSAEVRSRLAADLHEQLASSRLAWDAALLRSDAALTAGDQAEVRAALDDHRRLLSTLQERLGAVVAEASVAREAERVVRTSAAATTDATSTGASEVAADATPTGASERTTPLPLRRGVSSLVGAVAAILLVAGVLGGDLLPTTDGSIVRSGGDDPATADVRARLASQDTTGHAGSAYGVLDGPTPELPAFSGSLPPTPPPAGGDGSAATTTADGRDDRSSEPEAAVDERSTVDPAPVDAPATEEPDSDDGSGLGDLVEHLRDPDGGNDVDTPSSLPRPLVDLVEAVGDRPALDPGSDPTGGLR